MARGFALGFQSANAVGSKLIEAGLEIVEIGEFEVCPNAQRTKFWRCLQQHVAWDSMAWLAWVWP